MNIDFGIFTRDEMKQNFVSEFLKEIEKGLKNMKEYTLDRFEGKFAICEDRETGEMVEFERNKLPQNSREGSILKYFNGKFEIDNELEGDVSSRIKQKMDNLWNN